MTENADQDKNAGRQFVRLLDHGFVRLVDSMGDDLSVVRNARVSYDAAWRAGEDQGSDKRLISYLYRNGHNTPFESVVFTFEIKAPIFVFRQWHRHRTQSYNEISARYKELPEEFYIPEPHLIGKQSADNKQMRDITGDGDRIACNLMRKQNTEAFAAYRLLLERGVPREIARSILPTGTYSHMFATMNLHNLFRFLSERLHEHAQHEIRVYAEAIQDLIAPIVPECHAAFEAAR